MHFIHFHDFYCFVRPKFIGSFTKSLYPPIDRNVATFEKSAYGVKPKSFEVKFEGLSFDVRTFPKYGTVCL